MRSAFRVFKVTVSKIMTFGGWLVVDVVDVVVVEVIVMLLTFLKAAVAASASSILSAAASETLKNQVAKQAIPAAPMKCPIA